MEWKSEMIVALEKLFGIVITFIWVPIISSYYNIFLVYRKENTKKLFYSIWIIYCLLDNLFMQDIIDSMLGRIFYTVLAGLIVGIILYKSKIKTIMLVAISFYCIAVVSEGIAGVILILRRMQPEEHLWTGWIISRLIILMITQIIRINHKNRMEGEVTLTYWAMSVLTPIGSMMIICIIMELNLRLMNVTVSIMSSFALFIMLLLNMFIFSIYDKLQKEAAIHQANIMYEQQAKIYKLQCEEREAIWLESRKLYHDFKHHLVCLKGYNEEHLYKEMNEYLHTLVDGYATTYWQSKSGNMVIDSLLSYQMKKAEDANIVLNTDFEIPSHMPFEDFDLCIIVGNGFDNAVEAVLKEEEQNRKIDFQIKFKKNVLSLKITNPYTGEMRTDENGKLLTTKKNKEKHGIGLYSIEKTVEKYDGIMKIEKENDLFRLMIIMYGKGNNRISE